MADFENFSQAIAKYNSSLPTLSDGEANALQVDVNGRLLVQADVSVVLSHVNDSVKIGDGTDFLAIDSSGNIGVTQATSPWVVSADGGSFAVTQSGTWNINNISGTISLPTGASTLAEQQTQTTSLQLLDNLVLVDGAAWSAGSSGAELLAVRKDATGPLTGVADGDLSPLQVNSNGELKVSAVISGGDTEADTASDPTGDGLIALTAGPDVVVSKSVGAGTNLRIYGWNWSADRSCTFRLEVYDGAALVEILRVGLNSGSMPGDHMEFNKPIEIAGAATRVVRVAATKASGQAANGFASAAINCATF